MCFVCKACYANATGVGFCLMIWAVTMEAEKKLAKEANSNIRCIPNGVPYAEAGKCFLAGLTSSRRVIFARSY